MIFEKLDGGTLLHNIWRRGLLREHDVSKVVKNIADGLFFLHQKGKMPIAVFRLIFEPRLIHKWFDDR